MQGVTLARLTADTGTESPAISLSNSTQKCLIFSVAPWAPLRSAETIKCTDLWNQHMYHSKTLCTKYCTLLQSVSVIWLCHQVADLCSGWLHIWYTLTIYYFLRWGLLWWSVCENINWNTKVHNYWVQWERHYCTIPPCHRCMYPQKGNTRSYYETIVNGKQHYPSSAKQTWLTYYMELQHISCDCLLMLKIQIGNLSFTASTGLF